MDTQYSFGKWLQKRRKALDLTREELAKCAGCSKSALQKIEGDERRPSKQLAELLAVCLKIPSEDIPSFIKIARGGFSPGKLNLADPLPTLSLISELPSPDPQTNLPVPPTQLVGREPELVVLSRLLRDEDCRLVTLVGPGGIGKTRLAIETAMTHQDLFAAGAYFVSLSPLNTPDFIVDAVAGALQLAFSGPADPKTQLLGHLGKKQILLVLDNFEHLMEGAGLVAEILQRAPAVKMIATSREQLNLQGEWLFELQGLPVPESDAAEIESNSAVALFIQSARRAQVGYQLKVVDHPAVVRICKLVEGMPLGIELAAAWVGTLSCQEIAQEIERSLDFLSMSRRDMPDRHRSLRAVFEHSWRLLSKDEQSVMRQLAVFRGGFTRQAASQVAGAALPLLSALLAKSLIHRKSDTRYDLHELVRQYAREKLAEDLTVEAQALEQHRRYFVDFLTHLHPKMRGPEMRITLEILQADFDNVRDAWKRTINGHHFTGLQQAEKCLYDFFDLRGRIVEGYLTMSLTAEELRAELISHPENPELRTLLGLVLTDQSFFSSSLIKLSEVMELARQGAGHLCGGNDPPAFGYAALWLADIEYRAGLMVEAEGHISESLDVFKQCGDQRGVATALGSEARTALISCRFHAGRQAAGQAEMIYRRYGEEAGIARILNIRSELALHEGHYLEARRLLDESLALSRQAGIFKQAGTALHILAQVVQRQNDLAEAQRLLEECLTYFPELEALPNRLLVISDLGDVLGAQRDFSQARILLCEALSNFAQLEYIPSAIDVLLNFARLFSRQGALDQALGVAFFITGEPRARPLTKHYAEELCVEMKPRLTPLQIEAAREYARKVTFDSIVPRILNTEVKEISGMAGMS